VQQFEALCSQLIGNNKDACHVAAGPTVTLDKPSRTGSPPVINTIGIVDVSFLSARVGGALGPETISLTGRAVSSAARADNRS
jgi:hypothetical protein